MSSRVEDERDAARQAARLTEQRRLDESQKKEKAQAEGTFSRLVGGQKEVARAKSQQQHQAKESAAKSAIASLLEHAETAQAEAARQGQQGRLKQSESSSQGRLQRQLGDGKAKAHGQAAQLLGEGKKNEADVGLAQTSVGRESDAKQAASRGHSRQSDAAITHERLEERKEAGESASSSGRSGQAGAEKGELKTDADGGGQKGNGGGKDDKGGAGAAGFRFNPALMAPVPVAKPKEATGSDRLRKIAAELAQKIVERVRVGTNAAGRVEFQIDLKSDVLSGLSVKVSSHQGKIKAVFSGADRDVLRAIEEHSEALKSALTARGLSLEELKVEARA